MTTEFLVLLACCFLLAWPAPVSLASGLALLVHCPLTRGKKSSDVISGENKSGRAQDRAPCMCVHFLSGACAMWKMSIPVYTRAVGYRGIRGWMANSCMPCRLLHLDLYLFTCWMIPTTRSKLSVKEKQQGRSLGENAKHRCARQWPHASHLILNRIAS